MTAIRDDRARRIRETLGQPGLSWVVERARRRLERGEPLEGRVILRSPTSEERSALRRLVGHDARGESIAVDLTELEGIFRRAGLCERLAEAIEALVGSVTDRRSAREALRERWRCVFANAERTANGRDALMRWLADIREAGLLVRFAKNDPDEGERLLLRAFGVLDRLPADGVLVAELAAEMTGDAHALDSGTPLATLVLRAAALLGGAPTWDDAAERRDVLASVGVLCDDLSSHVLTLGLWGDDDSLTARALRLHASAGVPYRMSLRQLRADSTAFRPCGAPVAAEPYVVSVCENPSVLAAVATRRGAAAAPIVCTEGQPSTAVRVLLARLCDAGAMLRYHGDFDWAGIRIANSIIGRYRATPWRYRKDDYERSSGGTALTGSPVEAIWDPALATAMAERGEAVHEESVMGELVADV